MLESISTNPSFQKLLVITEQIIQEKGCRKTTLQEIIQRSGLSKGAIYHYVKSKDELFGIILLQKLGQIDERFNETVSNASYGDLKNPLLTITSGVLESINNKNDVTNAILIYLLSEQHNLQIQTVLSQVYNYSLQKIADWIKIGQKYGAIPPEINSKSIALTFLTYTYGIRMTRLMDPASEPIKIEELFEIFFSVLHGKKGL